MPKLPARLPYEALIAATLALGSCSSAGREQFTTNQREEITDIADAAVSDNDKVQDLERRVQAIEDRLNM